MIVITGGAGFIGSNLIKALNERGHTDLLVVDDPAQMDRYRNLADLRISDLMLPADFRHRLEQGKLGMTPDFILHQGSAMDDESAGGRPLLEANFGDSKAILHYCLLHKVPLVYGSCSTVYGRSTSTVPAPVHERPETLFAYSKLLFDQHVRSLLGQSQSTVVGLRYFTAHGPREQHKGEGMSGVARLLRELKNEGVCRLYEGLNGLAPGEYATDLIHVSDLVELNLHFASGEVKKGIFNAGSGTAHTQNAIAQALIHQLGQGRIEYVPAPSNLWPNPDQAPADVRALREAGFTAPFKSLEAGIAATLAEA